MGGFSFRRPGPWAPAEPEEDEYLEVSDVGGRGETLPYPGPATSISGASLSNPRGNPFSREQGLARQRNRNGREYSEVFGAGEEVPLQDPGPATEISEGGLRSALRERQQQNLSAPLKDLQHPLGARNDLFSLGIRARDSLLADAAQGLMSGVKKIGGFISDPTGDTRAGLAAQGAAKPAAPSVQARPDALAKPQPTAETEPEEQWTLKGNAGVMGPSDRELLRGPAGQQVKMSIGGKEYDYTGASQGLKLGNHLQGSDGSVSFADVSGETPGAERLAAERRQRALSQLRDQTQLAGGQEQLRLAQMSPEQRALEQRGIAKKEFEMLLGISEKDYIAQAGAAAAAELAADPRFTMLDPQKQAVAVQRKRQAAEMAAQQDYMTRIQELYVKRFNTSAF